MNTTLLFEALFNGLSFSSILILTALGLAITFGVMRVINMAHGEMLMLGAYTSYVVINPNGWPKLVSGLRGQITYLADLFGFELKLESMEATNGVPYFVSKWVSAII